MRILIIILFTVTFLMANADKTCYTVQLISKYNSKKNLDLLNANSYPNNCKVMQIGNSITVRCGCYERMASVKEELLSLKKDYKKAVVATTYKYRFENMDKEKDKISIVEKVILTPMAKKEKTVEVKEKKVIKSKESCYTVQLVSKYNSKNLL